MQNDSAWPSSTSCAAGSDGAAKGRAACFFTKGRSASRRDWRIVREVFVADSDEEAWRLSVGGMMGRMYEQYYLRLLGNFGFLEFLKHSPDVPDGDVTAEYCARHNWVVGSPRTVTERLEEIYDELGGFGCLLLFCFDYSENPRAWKHSMELLAEEVVPRLAHLEPASVAA